MDNDVIFLPLLLLQIGFVGFFSWRYIATKSTRNRHFLVCLGMLVIYGYELIRELVVCFGGPIPISSFRILQVRFEHTVLGLFLCEVMHYVEQLQENKKHR